MDAHTAHLKALLELEARHEDVLHRLEELDRRVQQVLARYLPSGQRVTAEGKASASPVEVSRLVDRPPQAQAQDDT